MNFNDYQRAALRTANTGPERARRDRLANWALGLIGEAGEIAEDMKKHLYHEHELDHAALVKELGDVLWYLAVLAQEVGVELEEVATTNIAKLLLRYPDGFSPAHSMRRVDEGREER